MINNHILLILLNYLENKLVKIKTVPQNRYEILLEGDEYNGLVTRGIFTCTGVFGINKNTGVMFLIHIDVLWGSNHFKNILEEAITLSGGDDHFNLELVNGNSLARLLGNPILTRNKIKKVVNGYSNITIVKDHGYSPFDAKRDVQFVRGDKELLITKNRGCSSEDKRQKGKLQKV